MPFGKKYEYNPIPTRLGMLLVAYQDTGKSSFASKMVRPGKDGLVIDADGRFGDVITPGVNFYPLSDKQSDMLDPKKIHDIMMRDMPKASNIDLALVDSVTNILEPIILQIQRDVAEGVSSGARGYKQKADAMKYLSAAFQPWGIDVIWVYHYRNFGDVSGKKQRGESVSQMELARLWRNINIHCEIVVDDNGKRGVKVLAARGGRKGITIWDDSGKWENIRERLLQAVWGGLTQTEQTDLLDDNPGLFSSSSQAIAWAIEQGAFDDVESEDGKLSKAKNSMKKLYTELKEELGEEFNEEILYAAWVDKVNDKTK